MKNIRDLRDQLSEVFSDLKSGKIKHKDAAEINNCAGKIISSCKVELEYYNLRKEAPHIEFLHKDTNEN